MAISVQDDDDSKYTEKIWLESDYFGDQWSNLTILKANVPENTLVYVNQGSVSLVKGGGQAIYLEFVVCGQLMPIANPDPTINLETHVFKENQALLYEPIYNKTTGLYGDLTKKLAYITLRFYNYGYFKEKSTFSMKSIAVWRNIFHYTAFKKHHGFILDENQKQAKFSNMFLYLPSILDRKEDFLQWKDHVHLHPVDVSYEELKAINNGGDMNPALLDHKEVTIRKEVTGAYYKMMEKITEVSNKNLIRNSDVYISNGGKVDRDNEFSGVEEKTSFNWVIKF